jgi:hypothetical protein
MSASVLGRDARQSWRGTAFIRSLDDLRLGSRERGVLVRDRIFKVEKLQKHSANMAKAAGEVNCPPTPFSGNSANVPNATVARRAPPAA